MFQSIINRDTTRYLILDQTYTNPNVLVPVSKIDFNDKRAGYFGCRFHYVIHRNGNLESGRPLEKQSPVSQVYNNSAICVALVGGRSHRGFPTDNFTPQQKETLADLVNVIRADHPDLEVLLKDDVISRKDRTMRFNVEPYNR